jgi:hypothetical protein
MSTLIPVEFFLPGERDPIFEENLLALPRAGDYVTYEFRPVDRTYWAAEALAAGDRLDGRTFRVRHVEHNLLRGSLAPCRQAVLVTVEPCS